MALSTGQPTLIVIDVQRAFDNPGWGPRNNPDAERQVAALLRAWRTAGAPLIHVRHRSDHPDGVFRGRGFEFKGAALPAPEEPIVEKTVHCAFIGTDLEQRLRDGSVQHVVIAGLTTDHCCSTTARVAADLGFRVTFTSDATATFARTAPSGRTYSAEEMHDSALTSLSREFAEVVPAAGAIARLSDERAETS
jgi:nicotinamidase-related amidase